MQVVFWSAAAGISTLVSLPTLVFAAECLSGCLPVRWKPAHSATGRSAVAILVPAHDEERGIAATVASLRAQMRSADRLIVVADNCLDRTADIARQAGAEVLERQDAYRRGKGYAMEFGLAYVSQAPLPIVVFIDADCTLTDGSLDELARWTEESGRPVQSCNLMIADRSRQTSHAIAEFAFRVKNLIRPRGLTRLGLPCLLTGTGMALPWDLVVLGRLANNHLAEDMQFGIDLATDGHAPVYCEAAGVRSVFPETAQGTTSQRSRWEIGHLSMMASSLARLFTRRGWSNRACLAMTLSILVPPLALLAFLHVFALMAGLVAWRMGSGVLPLAISLFSAALFLMATATAWVVHGRDIVPLSVILRIPQYMIGKASIYPRAMFGQFDRAWVRTDRSGT